MIGVTEDENSEITMSDAFVKRGNNAYQKAITAKPAQDSYTGTVGNIAYKGVTKDGANVEVKGIDIVSGEIVTDKGNYAAEDIAFADTNTTEKPILIIARYFMIF